MKSNKNLIRITQGISFAVLLSLMFSMSGEAFATGLIYGQSAGSVTDTSGDSVSLGSESTNRRTTSGDTSVSVGDEAVDYFVGVDLGSDYVAGTRTTDAVSSGTSSDTSSSGGLIYGTRANNLFGIQTGFLTISGQTGVGISFASDSFQQTYTALETYVYLRNQGFTSAAACGVLGNILRESSFDPTDTYPTNGAYGLYQCLGDMKERLLSACTDPTDAMQQNQAMIEEIAPDLFRIYGKNANGITYAQFKQLSDPSEAAEVWRAVVERNHYSEYDTSQRKKFAESFYAKWGSYSGGGLDVIREAVKYLGGKYVLGGNSLTNGIDCSHYVCKILELTGHYSGEYRTSAGLRAVGTEVGSLAQAEPGDILCWSGHVALYIADGYYIHAANEKSGICIGNNDILTMLGGLITIRRVR